ncbi:hypothetical protein B1222_08665 [Paenibacillus larvae subsp. pulvifaciens]|nr:hypothetical protein B1222_08665 [Paenibacillus larvae subsp. pulvifaciens]AQZ46444.1 hypothetical protein B5S25_07240 [Paenibacillus larvae subsp. pulvifaciens]MBH0343644.1 hypothetical protein [Paenibacillus larvae]
MDKRVALRCEIAFPDCEGGQFFCFRIISATQGTIAFRLPIGKRKGSIVCFLLSRAWVVFGMPFAAQTDRILAVS